MAVDSTTRFTDRVNDYARYRPSYPLELIGVLGRRWPHDAVVADVGAGTGLFTRLVAPFARVVHALEPNAAMLQQGREASASFPNIAWSLATSEATGLPDRSLDALVCAQAFHWFDQTATAREWRRVLRPGAPVSLIWNERVLEGSALQGAYEELLLRWSPEYPAVNHRNLTRAQIEAFFAPAPVTVEAFENTQRFDLEGWRGRLRSASYCPAPGQPGHHELMDGLAELFGRFVDPDGLLTFPYRTVAYTGRLDTL